jgi:TonB-linked SusC/RagA family outer membrane protein
MKINLYPSIRKSILTLYLILLSLTAFSQSNSINLKLKDQTLSTVFKSIEQQTSYRIVYNSIKIDANKKVSITINKGTIESVLQQLFKGTAISYAIKNNQVLLTDLKVENTKTSATQKAERLIKGKVISVSDNFPLAGATILIKGTSAGAITNIDGAFTYLLKGADIDNIVLLVSFLGYKNVEVTVGSKNYFEISLEEDFSSLKEVIITSSYGTKKLKEEVVGSISTLTSKDIAVDQASESIDKMIDGQIAGVLIENTSGIGGPVKINIRGQGSLTPIGNQVLGTSTQPLIIIDGVIIAEETGIDSSFFDGSGSFTENLSNPLAQISPENIESFTVLKDAAAVSLYGADGANGVIIITTKQGKKGKTKFGFSSQLGLSSAINQIEYLNGAQYNELRNEYLSNTGVTIVPYNGVNTDWFDLLNGTGIFNKYNFNVSGGTSKLSFRTSLTYLKIDEPQLGNSTKQLNAGINLGYNSDKLDVTLSLNPSYIQKNAPNIYYSYAFAPTISPYEADGSYSFVGVAGLGNPLAAIEQNKNLSDTYGLFGSINFSYKINESIKFSTLFGVDLKDKEQDRYFSGENESGRASGTFTLNGTTYPSWGRRVVNKRNSIKWNWQGQALYDKKLDENNTIDGLIGFELSKEQADFSYAAGRGFVNPNIINGVTDAIEDDNPLTEDDETTDGQTYSDDINYNSRVSLFSQLNYNYKKRYYFLGNFRRDQSSVFGDDTDVAYNGGIGLAWILTNETFFDNTNWIDFLKLKVSYGTTGNSRIGSYRSKGLYTFFENGYNGLDYAYPNSGDPPNGKLSWEKNTKFNIGLDFNFLNRINLTLEFYYDNLEDLITGRDIPTETGYSSVQLNAASMYNKGFELSTQFKWFKQDAFKWTTSFNISTLQSEVTNLVGLGSEFSAAQDALAQRVGYSTSTIWGVRYAGIDPATGRELAENNGQIYDAATYNSLFNNSDWVPIGDRQPSAFGGFNNSMSYKNISLSIRGSFQIGGEFLVQDELISQYRISTNRNMSVNAYDYWRQQGGNALQPLVINNNPILPNLSKFLYDATFLKISNINLNYNVPIQKIKFIDALSLFVDVSNVLYWYKQKSPSDRNGLREFRFTYPQARTISLGLNTKF